MPRDCQPFRAEGTVNFRLRKRYIRGLNIRRGTPYHNVHLSLTVGRTPAAVAVLFSPLVAKIVTAAEFRLPCGLGPDLALTL